MEGGRDPHINWLPSVTQVGALDWGLYPQKLALANLVSNRNLLERVWVGYPVERKAMLPGPGVRSEAKEIRLAILWVRVGAGP